MTYYQFVHAVEAKVKESMKETTSVHIHTTMKNNGRERKGLTIVEQGINISPTIYLEEYYHQFQRGSTLERIAGEIIRLYGEVRFQHSWEGEYVQSYDKIKDMIVYHLINRERNKELLKQIPYVPYMDLAIVFYVLIEVNKYGTASMLIRNEHLKEWDVTKEMVYQSARRNTEKILPYEFNTMKAVIEEMAGAKREEKEDVMYVLSNKIRNYGAAAILYQNRLKNIGDYLKENYYVLPSSIHEVIIVPESEAPSQNDLSAMVKEINESQVEEEEVLSDWAYYYDRETDNLIW